MRGVIVVGDGKNEEEGGMNRGGDMGGGGEVVRGGREGGKCECDGGEGEGLEVIRCPSSPMLCILCHHAHTYAHTHQRGLPRVRKGQWVNGGQAKRNRVGSECVPVGVCVCVCVCSIS